MREIDTAAAGGTCPECGHNEHRDRVTIQKAIPVVISFLETTTVADILSDDLDMGMAAEDMLAASLKRINERFMK